MTTIGAVLAAMDRVDECPSVGYSTFDDVLARHQAEMCCFAVRLTRDRVGANDLYQETPRKAFHAFDQLDGPANYRAWLFTIATTAFLSDRRQRGPAGSLDAERADEMRETSPVGVEPIGAGNVLREVGVFVAALPRHQWVALVQRKFHDLSYAEIAATLCCSEGVARASVHEALRTPRARFGDRL